MNCIQQSISEDYALYNGDCCEVIKEIPDNCVGLTVHSPPFANLYIYSDSIRDMGNCSSEAEFFEHYEYLIGELYRVTKPGRLCVVHCKDLPKYMNRDGASGLSDFPGAIIRAFEKHKWVYHSRVTIWKDPVIEMQRTKNHGLLYKELCKDSAGSRQGMADFLVVFRKWSGDGKEEFTDPVTVGGERFEFYEGMTPPDCDSINQSVMLYPDEDVRSRIINRNSDGNWPKSNPYPAGTPQYRAWSIMVWQKYASPVWFDIDQTKVLNYRLAREGDDEKHLCPLQLQLIARCVHLWSNPGDVVFTPFLGIGSEAAEALRLGRKAIGIELKDAYWKYAVKNCERVIAERLEKANGLFDAIGVK